MTDVCRMTGARSSSAAARTASMVRSSRMLKAATPYRSAKARSRISFVDTTGTGPPLRRGSCFPGGATAAARPVNPAGCLWLYGELPPSTGGRKRAPSGVPESQPRSSACTTAAVRPAVPVLRSTAPTCFSTVFGEMPSRAAISRSDRPPTSRASTSVSRRVSDAGDAAGLVPEGRGRCRPARGTTAPALTTAGATLWVSSSKASTSAAVNRRRRPAKATLTPITSPRHHSGTAAAAPRLAGWSGGRWRPCRSP